MAFLELQDLRKTFTSRRGAFGKAGTAEVRAVDGVSFSLERGEIMGLVGESGCGKTTLCRLIMQLLEPSSGRVVLDGESLSELSPGELRRRRIDFQMVFQDPYASLNPRMTVSSMLEEAVRQRHPDWTRAQLEGRVGELLERVGMARRFARRYPHEFSGGQRQRVAIARALAPEPKLVIADEPVSALDVSIQSQILNLLQELRRELNLTMLFISHDLGVVRYMADRMVVMRRGQIVESGEAEQLFRHPGHPYTVELLAAIPKIARRGGDRS
jgi:oligopeptide transport system ATP-binding protein